MIRFVMVRVGDRYGPEYVSILQDMIARNASNLDEFTIECVTDRPWELPEHVGYIEPNPDLPGWWQKVHLFSKDMPWAIGDRIVYFDLDVAITGRLEDLAERKGIIQDWHWPCWNSSVMVWEHGEHRHIWEAFTPSVMTRPARADLAPLLPAGQVNGGDQEWISTISHWETFPREWFPSYRDCKAWPPNGAKAVILHGDPKPHEVTEGWVPNVWKVGGLTSLPEFKGVNTTEEQRLENVKASVQRDLEWFSGFPDEGKACVIVCGGPSMKRYVQELKRHKARGDRIVSVNNAWRFLHQRGITPDVHVMLDARPENAEFVKGAPKSMRFLLASQCHPAVFDALEGYEVVLWHNKSPDPEPMVEALQPWWDEGPNQKPCILVPGGSTVGLRSLWLATYSGFRTIHIYGMDSSYAADGSHHAYAQSLNDGENVLDVVMGEKSYRCAPWMLRQAEELKTTWADLKAYEDFEGNPAPVTIHVYGEGLVPDIAKALRSEERAAA